jgi:hypothetical protein
MVTLTGTVLQSGSAADGAYVQLRNSEGDFIGEVRADESGSFVLYACRGTWQVVAWAPGRGRTQQQVRANLDDDELDVVLVLS